MRTTPTTQARKDRRTYTAEEWANLPRIKCKNCGKLTPKGRAFKKFCCTECRNQWHQFGGNAYGPMKEKIEKLVRTSTKQIFGELEQQIFLLRKRVSELEDAAPDGWPS